MNPGTPAGRKRVRSADSISDRGVKPQSENGIVPVLVVGMHRSGTSAVARALSLMGVDVGNEADLLPPHPTDNPTGYWERADIVALHEKFLKSGGYAWNAVGGFKASELDDLAKAALRDGLCKAIGELEQSGHSWLVKDPRLCLLLSQWLPLFDRSACVVVVRDPREIAASFLREQLRGAYTSHFLLALWEKYLRSALADLAGKHVLFVSYENLLTNPLHEIDRLSRSLSSLGVTGLKELPESALRASLDPRLKRSEALLHAALSEAQQALADWLTIQSQAPSTVVVKNVPEGPSPDAILIEYREVIEYVTKDSRDQALVDLTSQVSGFANVISGTQEQLSALRKEQWETISALRQDHGHTAEQISALRQGHWDQISALRQDQGHTAEQVSALRQEQGDQISALRQDQGHMTEQVSALRQEQGGQISALRQDLGHMTEQVSALRQEQGDQISALRQELGRLSGEVLRSIGDNRELSGALAEGRRLEGQLSELQSEIRRATEHAASVDAERQDLLGQLVEKRSLEERLSALEAELKRAIEHGKALESDRRDLSSQVEQLGGKLSSAKSELESTRRSRARALDAAVKIRRELDAQLSNKQSGDNQTGVDPE